MLASMLQRRGNSDELDDEIFKNALTTNYLGMSSLCMFGHPLTLDLAGVETVSTVKGLDSFIYCICSQIQSALSIAFWCVALHPDAQKRAQDEIDRVVGTERLPNFEDRESLPYNEALWRETLRWRPALPVGNAHATIADDEYEGYFFPKGKFQSYAE
jgi:hypothetical protein